MRRYKLTPKCLDVQDTADSMGPISRSIVSLFSPDLGILAAQPVAQFLPVTHEIHTPGNGLLPF